MPGNCALAHPRPSGASAFPVLASVWASTSAVISIGIDAVVHQVATFRAQPVTQILARSAMVPSICPEQRSRL
jgi:hypothetical protein